MMYIPAWESKPKKNNKLFISIGVLLSFILVHAFFTHRAEAQKDFARLVEKGIGISSIQVKAVNDVMVLSGIGTKPQKEYAEKKAAYYLKKWTPSATNPPTQIRNEIQLKPTPKIGVRKKASRHSMARRGR